MSQLPELAPPLPLTCGYLLSDAPPPEIRRHGATHRGQRATLRIAIERAHDDPTDDAPI